MLKKRLITKLMEEVKSMEGKRKGEEGEGKMNGGRGEEGEKGRR